MCFVISLLLYRANPLLLSAIYPEKPVLAPQNMIGHLFLYNLCFPLGILSVTKVICNGVINMCPIHRTLNFVTQGDHVLYSLLLSLISLHWEIIQQIYLNYTTKYFICLEFYVKDIGLTSICVSV